LGPHQIQKEIPKGGGVAEMGPIKRRSPALGYSVKVGAGINQKTPMGTKMAKMEGEVRTRTPRTKKRVAERNGVTAGTFSKKSNGLSP